MRRSFSFRRSEITDENPSLGEIFDKFPFFTGDTYGKYCNLLIHLKKLILIYQIVYEMELIMKNPFLKTSSKDQWVSKLSQIQEQVGLEISRGGKLSSFLGKVDCNPGK